MCQNVQEEDCNFIEHKYNKTGVVTSLNNKYLQQLNHTWSTTFSTHIFTKTDDINIYVVSESSRDFEFPPSWKTLWINIYKALFGKINPLLKNGWAISLCFVCLTDGVFFHTGQDISWPNITCLMFTFNSQCQTWRGKTSRNERQEKVTRMVLCSQTNKNALPDFKSLRLRNGEDEQIERTDKTATEGQMEKQNKLRQIQTNQKALKHTTRGGSLYLNTS